MPTMLNPYLSFRDNARQAMEFYHSVFGGELSVSTFGESGMSEDPAEAEKVMHSMLIAPGGLVLMGSDTPSQMEYQGGSSISVSLSGEDEDELRGYWDKLSDGGTVVMPMDKAPWGDFYGQVTDRYGIAWMFDVGAP